MRISPISWFSRALALLVAIIALPALAQDQDDVLTRWRADPSVIFDASEVNLAELRYLTRPLIVFGDAPNHPQVQDQLRLLAAGMDELTFRNVILVSDTDPSTRSDARNTLRPRGFSLVLLDLDGTVVFRKPDPWSAREIGRQIDKLPSRQQELRTP